MTVRSKIQNQEMENNNSFLEFLSSFLHSIFNYTLHGNLPLNLSARWGLTSRSFYKEAVFVNGKALVEISFVV